MLSSRRLLEVAPAKLRALEPLCPSKRTPGARRAPRRPTRARACPPSYPARRARARWSKRKQSRRFRASEASELRPPRRRYPDPVAWRRPRAVGEQARLGDARRLARVARRRRGGDQRGSTAPPPAETRGFLVRVGGVVGLRGYLLETRPGARVGRPARRGESRDAVGGDGGDPGARGRGGGGVLSLPFASPTAERGAGSRRRLQPPGRIRYARGP